MPLPLPLRMLDWRERKKDGPIRNKCERIVIFKRLFDPKEFEVRIQTQQEPNNLCLCGKPMCVCLSLQANLYLALCVCLSLQANLCLALSVCLSCKLYCCLKCTQYRH